MSGRGARGAAWSRGPGAGRSASLHTQFPVSAVPSEAGPSHGHTQLGMGMSGMKGTWKLMVVVATTVLTTAVLAPAAHAANGPFRHLVPAGQPRLGRAPRVGRTLSFDCRAAVGAKHLACQGHQAARKIREALKRVS